MKINTILLDMDEVLVDFIGGMLKVHGISKEELASKRVKGQWDLAEQLGMSQRKFWNNINVAGEDFWLDLKPTPWIDDVLKLAEDNAAEWHIATSPSLSPTSYSGKVKWLKRYFGHDFDRFAITPHKNLFAKPGVVLIDDRERNTTNFSHAGGEGCLFPHDGNRLHGLAHDPTQYVKARLHQISTGETKCT